MPYSHAVVGYQKNCTPTNASFVILLIAKTSSKSVKSAVQVTKQAIALFNRGATEDEMLTNL